MFSFPKSITAREEGEKIEKPFIFSNVLVMCNATFRTSLCNNNYGLRHFQRVVSTGHVCILR